MHTDTLQSATLSLGANALEQATAFALCLAIGLCGGIVALLYLRKARPLERALTDLFATVCIGGLFLICIEFVLNGKFELYGAGAYFAGVSVLPFAVSRISARLGKKTDTKTGLRAKHRDESKKKAED